jgi:biopolymer transport protein ExbB
MKSKHRLLLIVLAIFFLGAMAGLAQDAAESAAPTVAAAHGSQGDSIIKVIWGGGWLIRIIWLSIIITSITMVTFIIQNILSLRTQKLAPNELVDSLQNAIDAGNYQEAWETCDANENYLANVLKTGLSRLGRGKEAVEDAVAESSLREAQILRTRNSYLSVIGVISPMIGLLGTVIGMMGAFGNLASAGISDPRGLAASIGEVLMATASGLFIAIPAFVAYYVFRNRSQMVIVYADDKINQLIIDLPYDELAGIQIGQNFNAGAGSPTLSAASESRRVSAVLTTNCPVCNGPVSPGLNPCPHCGATLDWAE